MSDCHPIPMISCSTMGVQLVDLLHTCQMGLRWRGQWTVTNNSNSFLAYFGFLWRHAMTFTVNNDLSLSGVSSRCPFNRPLPHLLVIFPHKWFLLWDYFFTGYFLLVNSLRPSGIYIYIHIYICVCKLTIIGSDNNGLSPGRHQAIIWTNTGIVLIGALETNCSNILIKFTHFPFQKIHLKMSSN